MSKVEAYRCDNCRRLVPDDEALGINPVEDMFDRLSSFPSMSWPERTDIHYCIGCYRDVVTVPASNLVNRKADEAGYKAKLRELFYGLRSQAVHNYRVANRHKK